MATRYYVYHTANYRHMADRMQLEFANYNRVIISVPLDDHGEWMLNCLQRCQHLATEAKLYPLDYIGLMDADLRVQHDPAALFNDFEGDVQVNDYGTNVAFGRRFSAGIICFSPTRGGRKLLDFWASECREDLRINQEGVREQYYLWRAIEQCRPIICKLDEKLYNNIPAPGQKPNPDAIVVHDWEKK